MFRLTLIHSYLIMVAHWIFIAQYLKTSIILPLMLANARVSLELDEFEEGQLGGTKLIEPAVVNFQD